MVNDDDLVRLAEDCIKICEVLRTGVEGKNVEDLSQPVKTAIADLGVYAHSTHTCRWAKMTEHLQGGGQH